MARSRALETGRPLVRASNNGLSALIAADGRILALAPQFQAAAVRGMVQPMQGTTPFVRYGNLLVVGLCLLLLLAGTSRRL
jgi:apolipoprotein N-acyltransferase